MRQEESFGIIPLAKREGRWEVFLIQHKRGRHWSFPKGHAERGEEGFDTAARELKEETNLDIVSLLQKEPLVEQYQFLHEGRRISKKVSYYVALVAGEATLQEAEVRDGIWVTLEQALERVTHPEGKSILRQVEQILPNL